MHKLSEDEILIVTKILADSYSDYVLSTVYLGDIHKEEITPSFTYPEALALSP